nr:hypothetical protein CFP56_23993 [Quercus suber]
MQQTSVVSRDLPRRARIFCCLAGVLHHLDAVCPPYAPRCSPADGGGRAAGPSVVASPLPIMDCSRDRVPIVAVGTRTHENIWGCSRSRNLANSTAILSSGTPHRMDRCRHLRHRTDARSADHPDPQDQTVSALHGASNPADTPQLLPDDAYDPVLPDKHRLHSNQWTGRS